SASERHTPGHAREIKTDIRRTSRLTSGRKLSDIREKSLRHREEKFASMGSFFYLAACDIYRSTCDAHRSACVIHRKA
ncbi:hypothetical protein, partial [Bacteroides heparinolyticus]|uniref:hypothetical protein n=1 Tax=Prevotella heparinolytica TaxID=28113 RepID=UPI00359F841D